MILKNVILWEKNYLKTKFPQSTDILMHVSLIWITIFFFLSLETLLKINTLYHTFPFYSLLLFFLQLNDLKRCHTSCEGEMFQVLASRGISACNSIDELILLQAPY